MQRGRAGNGAALELTELKAGRGAERGLLLLSVTPSSCPAPGPPPSSPLTETLDALDQTTVLFLTWVKETSTSPKSSPLLGLTPSSGPQPLPTQNPSLRGRQLGQDHPPSWHWSPCLFGLEQMWQATPL